MNRLIRAISDQRSRTGLTARSRLAVYFGLAACFGLAGCDREGPAAAPASATPVIADTAPATTSSAGAVLPAPQAVVTSKASASATPAPAVSVSETEPPALSMFDEHGEDIDIKGAGVAGCRARALQYWARLSCGRTPEGVALEKVETDKRFVGVSSLIKADEPDALASHHLVFHRRVDSTQLSTRVVAKLKWRDGHWMVLKLGSDNKDPAELTDLFERLPLQACSDILQQSSAVTQSKLFKSLPKSLQPLGFADLQQLKKVTCIRGGRFAWLNHGIATQIAKFDPENPLFQFEPSVTIGLERTLYGIPMGRGMAAPYAPNSYYNQTPEAAPLPYVAGTLHLGRARLYDWNDDNHPDLFAPKEAEPPLGDDKAAKAWRQLPRLYLSGGDKFDTPVPHETEVLLHELAMFNGDRRPGFITYGPFSARLPTRCGLRQQCPRALRGIKFYVRAKKGLVLSLDDPAALRRTRAQCKAAPDKVVVTWQGKIALDRTMKNIACARAQGKDSAALTDEINSHAETLCVADRGPCVAQAALLRAAKGTPPIALAAAEQVPAETR